MFLGFLNDDEKRAFIALAEHMIEADGIVVGSEREALAALRFELGLPPGEEDKRDLSELAEVFGSHRSKIAALLELIGLGYSDSRFNLDEKSMVALVAHEMAIDATDLARIEAWVKDHVNHINAAMEMMG
jgi:uncharacterized tellurite resistance protein B-like protein